MIAVILAALSSLILTLIVFPAYIAWLKRAQVGQYIREEGPQSHASKAKTPTMGGLCFMVTTAVASLVFIFFGQYSIPPTPAFIVPALAVLVVGMVCGLLGFADDFGKVTSKSNKGLSARLRLMVEFGLGFAAASVFAVLHLACPAIVGLGHNFVLDVPQQIIYGFIVVPFLIAATTNAINLHDGMDGLAAGTSVQVFILLALMTAFTGQLQLSVVAAAMAGALLGFLAFNRFPAQVFMGDTGSLFIGGIMAALVASSGLLIWFIPLALIYIAETISVIAQVGYFKLTKPYTPPQPMSKAALIWLKLAKRLPGEGKRLLRMAPLHHHFEAVAQDKGITEWKVVALFWLSQFVVSLAVAPLFFKLTTPIE